MHLDLKAQDSFDIHSALYWEENKQRLEKLIENLTYFNPGMQVPFLFTYFPDSSSTESTLEKVKQICLTRTNPLAKSNKISLLLDTTIIGIGYQTIN